MLFSFLVPVYNTEKYLKKCIDSLLIQKGSDFEILLLDDGSTDSSGAICDRYAAQYPNIRVIHKDNEGLLMTRRRGFSEARGEWFICVDSDDYVQSYLLETVIAAIKANDDCDMVMYNYQYVNNQDITSQSRLSIPEQSVFFAEGKHKLYEARLTSTVINNMWMRALRRDIVDIDADYSKCGIRNMCEDALQVLPLYTSAKKIVYIDRPLYFYRKGDGSITSHMTYAHWQAIFRSFALEEPYAELWHVSEDIQRKRYTRQMENICNCVRWLYKNVDHREIFQMIPAIMEESMFRRCWKHHHTKFASSKYSAVSVSIISRALAWKQFAFLEFFFMVENRMLGK